jgi:phospholipid/cholesterol/gamma-HCH transport system substrate-binding protein
MSRIAAVVLLLAALAAVVVVVVSNDEDESYKVRAIFDNAGFIIPGEDVKVAGVKVGTVDSVDVTDDFKAAIVLDITDPGYQDFREDAQCIVRPQSLIGERFVECEPTQVRAPGGEAPPELATIEEGDGEGQRLLPVENTSKSVDLDLVNNIMREPERERLSIILSELGVGVAGRGADLAEVIRSADPALKEIDEVLRILAGQNEELADLARNSDTVLAPLARERRRVGSAIDNAGAVAGATAERSADLRADLELLPPFLRELKPTMVELGALSDEMTPVLTDLGDVAPDINRLVIELGPFAQAGIPAFRSLGETAEVGTPAVRDALPVVQDTRRLASTLRPVSSTARALLESLQKTDGLERFLDYVFYQVAAINGFDSFGHYLRAGLIVNQCSTYAVRPTFGCSANFAGAGAASASAATASGRRDQTLVRTAAALHEALGLKLPEVPGERPAKPRRQRAPEPEPVVRRSTEGSERKRPPAATPTPAPTPAPPSATPTPAPRQSDVESVLDYLFGSDG